MNLIHKQESYTIVGACFEVYNELGNGFDEAVYHESLELEMSSKQLDFVSEPQIQVQYKGQVLEKHFRADMICFGKIIVELKAVRALNDFHRQQVLNYLKATGFRLGLLVNFGAVDGLEYERIVL